MEGSGAQGHHWLHNEIELNLGYISDSKRKEKFCTTERSSMHQWSMMCKVFL